MSLSQRGRSIASSFLATLAEVDQAGFLATIIRDAGFFCEGEPLLVRGGATGTNWETYCPDGAVYLIHVEPRSPICIGFRSAEEPV